MSDAALDVVREGMRRLADPQDAAFLQRFFKTGPGDYAEGDRFLGIRVPEVRRLARRFRALPEADVLQLLRSPWHEERLLALVMLVERFRRADVEGRATIHEAYLQHTRHVNNWDLVDASAEHIVGASLDPARLELLESLARSESVWERRIAMMATFHWIKQGEPRPALHIAEMLLHDRHDLIHKAVGWMLREVGKRDLVAEEEFLRRHSLVMPRTMLRYAIERFPEPVRQRYLRGDV
jgi:3-methyladenine DNA glycosylase AlkD